MKQLYAKTALAVVIGIAGILLLGWAGRVDYNEQVLLHMSQEDYDTIVSRLSFHGQKPSDGDIVDFYRKHFNHE
jgi:hypothetical protein